MKKYEQVTAGYPYTIENTTIGTTIIRGVDSGIELKPKDMIIMIDRDGSEHIGSFNYVEDHYIVMNNGSYITLTTTIFIGKLA